MLGYEPGGGEGPEVCEHVGAFGEVVLDSDALSWWGDGVVRPGCESGAPHCREDDGGGAVAEAEFAWLSGEEEITYHSKIPLRNGHVQVPDESAEAMVACEAIPGFRHAGLAGWVGRRGIALFHRVSSFEIQTDFTDGNAPEMVRFGGSEPLDDSDHLNHPVDTSVVGLGMFMRVGRCDCTNLPVRNGYYCRDNLVEIGYLGPRRHYKLFAGSMYPHLRGRRDSIST